MTLNSTTERFNSFIEKRAGLSLSEIVQMNNDEATAFIETKNNTKLWFDKSDSRVPRRGSALLHSDKIIWS
jgi:hypothetical protein